MHGFDNELRLFYVTKLTVESFEKRKMKCNLKTGNSGYPFAARKLH